MVNVQQSEKLNGVGRALLSAVPAFAAVLSPIAAFAGEEIVSTTGMLTFGGAESGFA